MSTHGAGSVRYAGLRLPRFEDPRQLQGGGPFADDVGRIIAAVRAAARAG